jgi:hypothetical protein
VASASQQYQIFGNKLRVGNAQIKFAEVDPSHIGTKARSKDIIIWAKVSDFDLSMIDCSTIQPQLPSRAPSSPQSGKARQPGQVVPSPLVTGIPKFGQLLPRHRSSADQAITGSQPVIYFKQRIVDFGCCVNGSFNRLKVELYNPTDREVRTRTSFQNLFFNGILVVV